MTEGGKRILINLTLYILSARSGLLALIKSVSAREYCLQRATVCPCATMMSEILVGSYCSATAIAAPQSSLCMYMSIASLGFSGDISQQIRFSSLGSSNTHVPKRKLYYADSSAVKKNFQDCQISLPTRFVWL